MADQKFRTGQQAERATDVDEVEKLKQAARVEETFPEADACEDCAAARKKSGDPTDLCPAHLKRIYGI